MRTTPKKLRITSLVPVFGLGLPLLIASACGTDAPGPVATGGTPTATGGTSSGTGGAPITGTGGTITATGGTVGTTGGIAGTTGGIVGTGGTVGQGGSTGGTIGQGGSTGGTIGQGGSTGGTVGQGGSTGGTVGQGGSTAGAGGRGGGTSTGGTTGGGTSTGGSSTGGTGAGGISDVAKALDGQMLLGPCKTNPAGSVCQTETGNCPNNNDPVLDGILTTNKTITLGGDTSKTYTITLHVQGEVEAKRYIGGTDSEKSLQSPKMNGFSVGGTPDTTNAYNVYALRVSSPKQDFFLNAVDPPGVSDHTTYGIDYTAKIVAKGGATVQLIAADSNCSMIKNCGGTPNNGSVCAAPITMTGIEAKAISMNPSFDFTKAYNGQWVVWVVTDVTAN
jgi:hypothetical protein